MMIKLEEKLKKNDLRLTDARRLIFDTLSKSNKSMTAKELHKSLKSKIDLASIYRNLTTFKEIGLVHLLNDGAYSICEHQHEDETHKHIHVILSCKTCGLAEEIKEHSSNLCDASKSLVAHAKTLNEVSSILLQGTCKNC